MCNDWFFPRRFSFYRNRINLPVLKRVLLGIVFCGSEHMLLFSGVDRFFRIPEASRGPRFDLDEDRDFATSEDQVNFPIGCADIPIHKFIAMFLQMLSSYSLAPTSDFLIMITHLQILPQQEGPAGFYNARLISMQTCGTVHQVVKSRL